MRYYTKIKISHSCRFHEIIYQSQDISWLHISWHISPESKYLMVADFMRYYTKALNRLNRLEYDSIRVHLIIKWELYIIPKSKYLMAIDFMRYNMRTKISLGFRFLEILPQHQNISWLQMSWDITPEPQYFMAADFVRHYSRTKISPGFIFVFLSVFAVCLFYLFCLFVYLFFCLFIFCLFAFCLCLFV